MVHAFDLPHAPGCEQNNCMGGKNAYFSFMYVGYAYYSNTCFLPENRQALLNSGFFSQLDLRPFQMFDYDNDGKIDFAVWRPDNGTFFILRNSTDTLQAAQWGLRSDIPTASAFVR